MKGIYLKKEKLPIGHFYKLEIKRKALEELMMFQTGDIEIIFIPEKDKYIANLKEKNPANIFGRNEESNQDDFTNVEPPEL